MLKTYLFKVAVSLYLYKMGVWKHASRVMFKGVPFNMKMG